MKTWDPDGPDAPVHGVPVGCRAVPLVEVVERGGERVEVRDRRRRLKTNEVVLVADRTHPETKVAPDVSKFALGAGRRRWATVRARFGEAAFDFAVSLVRARVVQLACRVDERGAVREPLWWQPTEDASIAVQRDRTRAESRQAEARAARHALVDELESPFPEIAKALANAESTIAAAVVAAAGSDLLAEISHAGPRAFVQTHFGRTKAHDVRAILTAAGVPLGLLGRLGLRRGDRIGLGGPVTVITRGWDCRPHAPSRSGRAPPRSATSLRHDGVIRVAGHREPAAR